MLEKYFIGDGASSQGFIHLEIKILVGRTNKIKSEIGASILKLLKKHFSEGVKLLTLQITVEIIDIQKNCYYKYP